MANPAFGAISPRFAGTVRKDSQNVEQVNRNRGKNKFTLRQPVLSSARFGEVTPFFSERLVSGDSVSLTSKVDVWSSVLQSPILQRLIMYKDYFYVPYKALLPNSWDSFKNVPIQGDDVPDDVYLNFPLQDHVYFVLSYLLSGIKQDGSEGFDVNSFFRSLACVRLLISSSSLPSMFKIGVSTILGVDESLLDPVSGTYPSFDAYVLDRAFAGTVNLPFTPESDTSRVRISCWNSDPSSSPVSFYILQKTDPNGTDYAWNIPVVRAFLDFLVNNPDWTVNSLTTTNNDKDVYEAVTALHSLLREYATSYLPPSLSTVFDNGQIIAYWNPSHPSVDISELYAYQSIGAQFYTNDDVDPVFTYSVWLDQYRQLLIDSLGASAVNDSYDYNGSVRYYDWLSYHYATAFFVRVCSSLNQSDQAAYQFPDMYFQYFVNLFKPFESLRFGDYLTGSRLSPLAIGASESASAPVVGEKVDAVDVTKSIAWQSFLNDIMKLGPVSWIQQAGIYGETPSTLDPMPRFISRERQLIGQSDTTNTSDSQGTISSRFRGNDSQYAFNVDISEDCIVIGLLSFDIPRFYVNMTHRFAFTYDRYDFFQPYFQNIGDQAIYREELNLFGMLDSNSLKYAFGWTLRDTQYKQRYAIANGAFGSNDFLPSWAFLTDCRNEEVLSPSFIRNHNSEFDRFFKSLTHVSLGGYFHFYFRADNNCEAVRSMQYRPGIQLPMFHQ